MTHVVQPRFEGIIFADAQEMIARQVFGPRRWRPFEPTAGTSITITVDAMSYTIDATGGGSPHDASLTIAQQVYQRHMPQIPEIRAGDASVTVTEDALGYILTATAGGAVDTESAMIAARAYRDRIQRLLTEIDLWLSDNTINNVNTVRHGLVPKAPNDTTKFLRGDGSWNNVSTSGVFDHVLATSYTLMES